MTWQRFDDRARDNPKVRRAGTHAVVLWWAAGNWCSDHLTDGLVPKDQIRDVWRPLSERFPYTKAITSAIRHGLLVDVGEHYEVHDYLKYNRSKSQVIAEREQARTRQEKHRESRRDSSVSHNAPSRPVPSRPLSDPPSEDLPKAQSASEAADIEGLEAKLGVDLCDQAREGVALTRKTRGVADSVWLRTLKKLEAHGLEAARHALTVYVDRYADGDHGEGYLVGIARGHAKSRRLGAQRPLRGPAPPADLSQRTEEDREKANAEAWAVFGRTGND